MFTIPHEHQLHFYMKNSSKKKKKQQKEPNMTHFEKWANNLTAAL